ncbi:hypothetical protein [Subtercola boreus]|uniref:Uncharacterized protein n=1 Tax=Subtercola boreus TaxID=120213 RepID=A0A3E0W5D3_9MICO|nr:hypothetical protein [Subtercola boreus]RFA17571.1 hypothetical protein B7R24_17045 [Subtercola boreus]RFA17707.1 hypothetical protein B7R23_16825 [Subtercola boreus]RFA24215.1 hypothetical protein B7R25_17230 [Subtercola boreus]
MNPLKRRLVIAGGIAILLSSILVVLLTRELQQNAGLLCGGATCGYVQLWQIAQALQGTLIGVFTAGIIAIGVALALHAARSNLPDDMPTGDTNAGF